MFKITKTSVFCVSMIILFCVIQVFIHQYTIESEIGEEILEIQEIEQEIPVTQEKDEIWQIEIPKISLIANISEKTTKEVLNQYVGHFETTAKENGNIGLAAYNRGNDVNYFKDLKLLKEGDEIIYKHNEFQKTYQVEKCRIIRKTEWQYLDEEDENLLTLITCIQNQPEYRRCIRAVEKEEE